jgi:hypothetical protein
LESRDVPVPLFAVGPDAGGAPHVRVFNTDGSVRFDFMAYDISFRGGVRVATGDVNGDGVADIATAPGWGGGPHIKIFDGRDGRLIREFMAYDPGFRGGAYVALGDIDRDGFADIVTGAGAGGGPHVRAYSGVDNAVMSSFMAYDVQFRGGVRVTCQRDSIYTGPGAGGGPHLKGFSPDGTLIGELSAFDPEFRGGIFVAAVDGMLAVSPGEGGGPHVRLLIAPGCNSIHNEGYFVAYDLSFTGGVRGAAVDLDGDGQKEIITGPGPGGGPHIKVWKVTSGVYYFVREFILSQEMLAFDPTFTGGVYVG